MDHNQNDDATEPQAAASTAHDDPQAETPTSGDGAQSTSSADAGASDAADDATDKADPSADASDPTEAADDAATDDADDPADKKDPELVAFGANVRRLRLKAKLTQEALAKRSTLHWTYISQVERGVRNTSYTSLCKLADGLGVHPGKMMGS